MALDLKIHKAAEALLANDRLGDCTIGMEIPDSWVKMARDDTLVVRDDTGVQHTAVLCDQDPACCDHPFVVTMCDYYEAIDEAVVTGRMNSKFKYPSRRWEPDQEGPGVITCLLCLGL